MNLKDNLRKIRKDNNLSQEDLAEKLGVSRQSVSKWESGLAYPEMDKVIQLCNMFDLNIDDLLNQDINKKEKEKQSKLDVGKYIDEFLSFFNKTMNMFSSMKFKDKFKCFIEQVIIFFMLLLVFAVIGSILDNIVCNILNLLPDNIYSLIHNLLESIYLLLSIVMGLILMIQIFKTRYLNYYVIVDKEDNSEDDKDIEEETNEKKYINNSPKEKVIIRDPNHSEYGFIKFILKVIVFFIKIFVGFFGLFICALMVFLVTCFVLSFLICKTGLLFIGTIISLSGGILLTYSVLNVIYNFIVNRKINFKIVGICLLISLILGGSGIGFGAIGVKDFNYIEEPDKKYLVTTEQEYDMNSKLVLIDNHITDINYIESDNKNIKMVITTFKGCNVFTEKYENPNYIGFYNYCSNTPFELVRTMLKGINNKQILNPDYSVVNVYTTKENIKIIKANNKEWYSEYK